MKNIRFILLLSVISAIAISISCAESQSLYQEQTKDIKYTQKISNIIAPRDKSKQDKIQPSPVVTKTKKVVIKEAEETDTMTDKSQFSPRSQTQGGSNTQGPSHDFVLSNDNSQLEIRSQHVVPESNEIVHKKEKQGVNTINNDAPKQYHSAYPKTYRLDIGGKSDLPGMLIGIVVAYLTILISVAIAIFSEKKEFETLDRNVILDYIIKAKRLLIYLGLTFFPLLFWNNSGTWMRFLEISIWILGLILLTSILITSYHWMKGNKYELRFGYLKGLKNRQDIEEAWRSVWQTKDINYQNEIEFFDIFRTIVDKLLENDKR